MRFPLLGVLTIFCAAGAAKAADVCGASRMAVGGQLFSSAAESALNQFGEMACTRFR